jgi:hypothetical protein
MAITTRLVYSGPDLIEETDAANRLKMGSLKAIAPGRG